MPRVLRTIYLFLLTCLALSLAACPARAQEEGPVRLKVTIHHHGGTEEVRTFNMREPKDAEALNKHLMAGEIEHLTPDKPPSILALQWELGLWTIVIFVLLYLILRRAAWGPMMEGLQKREQTILTAIEDAQKARAEAQRLHEEWERRMASAEDKAREIFEDARRKAERMTEDTIAKARTEIQGERDRLHREIETAKDQALQEIWNQTARLATLVSAKAIRRQITIDDQRRLVDEALAELQDRGKEWQRQAGGLRV